WSPASGRDWPGFRSRLAARFVRYRALGLHYADSAFAPQFEIGAANHPSRGRRSLSKQAPFVASRYTLDGTGATPDSRDYDERFAAADGSTVKASACDGARLLGGPSTLAVDRSALRRRTDEELEQCSGNVVLRLGDDAPLEGPRAVYNVDI